MYSHLQGKSTFRYIESIFSGAVRSRWEDILTVYFGQVFFFHEIIPVEDRTRVKFCGNPTSWKRSANHVYLDIRKVEENDGYEVVVDADLGWRGPIHVALYGVPMQGITDTPEFLVMSVHQVVGSPGPPLRSELVS